MLSPLTPSEALDGRPRPAAQGCHRVFAVGALLVIACLTMMECRAQGVITPAPAPVAEKAEQALRAKLAIAYPAVTRWEVSLVPTSVEAAQGKPDSHPSVTVTRVGQRSAVWVGSKSLGPDRRGALLWFGVAGYGLAVVAARPLVAGTALDSGDGALLERDIVGGGCAPLRDPQALVGKRSRRFLQAGEMICDNVLEPVPAVARGQEVTLLYTGRSFTLTAKGIAQADGLLGKRVTVRNVSSGEVFAATVTGRGEVSVDE